jgi:NADH-quinone oxidoreductase subunit I
MAYVVPRPELTFKEKAYLPSILSGMKITLGHFKKMITGDTKVTMQYPEEKWDGELPEYYRGAPTLVKDDHDRERCVACQLCEFICPPRAITITPEEFPLASVSRRSKSVRVNSRST